MTTKQGPVNLTELEKARRMGKIGDAVGISIFVLIILAALGLLLWGLISLTAAYPVIGWSVIAGISIIGLVSWAVVVSQKAEKMEEDAKKYGVVDE